MPAAPLPFDEQARLAELAALAILDTPPEAAYDDLVALAARLCGVPISLVSLVDAHRQWFKAAVGLSVRETPRDHAFCAHAILGTDPLVVPDATSDPRFADNPLVTGAPHIRFYAGVPLVTGSGARIGTLCVIDSAPRGLTGEQLDVLKLLSRHVTLLLEHRRALAAQRELLERQRALQSAMFDADAAESRRRSRELREDLVQLIAGARLRVNALSGVIRPVGDTGREFAAIAGALATAVEKCRGLAERERTFLLRGDGLGPAVRRLAVVLESTCGVEVDVAGTLATALREPALSELFGALVDLTGALVEPGGVESLSIELGGDAASAWAVVAASGPRLEASHRSAAALADPLALRLHAMGGTVAWPAPLETPWVGRLSVPVVPPARR